ncbi:PTS sugar transporter subunit IIA [Holdemania massiliensis]|uniref:PTS sugar transporter subunit IIA n=1 Tax=Holdemania massiliensis TaxID=1468449 RepID=UPI001F05B724|nr:PTS glucose transporter subunit IIA [Holdemania massiliensis]MCH1942680.1 PTS glucose transporter subunit IIA [Holdemania massiliensis]
MGLLDIFLKKEDIVPRGDEELVSPVKGKMVPPCEIPDDVFAEEMMGQTVGFFPANGDIVCPINGVVKVMFPTGHAFGIEGNDGNGYLVHIGINTVSLNGKGFSTYLKVGDKVKAGQKAVKVDLNVLNESNLNNTVILAVTEKKAYDFRIQFIDFGLVEKGQVISQ